MSGMRLVQLSARSRRHRVECQRVAMCGGRGLCLRLMPVHARLASRRLEASRRPPPPAAASLSLPRNSLVNNLSSSSRRGVRFNSKKNVPAKFIVSYILFINFEIIFRFRVFTIERNRY